MIPKLSKTEASGVNMFLAGVEACATRHSMQMRVGYTADSVTVKLYPSDPHGKCFGYQVSIRSLDTAVWSLQCLNIAVRAVRQIEALLSSPKPSDP